MLDAMALSTARPTNGAWSRLKPVILDPLDEMGLTSKGDNRLLDFNEQKRYYNQIVDRYMTVCSRHGASDVINHLSSAGNISSKAAPIQSESKPQIWSGPPKSGEKMQLPLRFVDPNKAASAPALSTTTTPMLPEDAISGNDASKILMAMRKLREALIASLRFDTFALNVYKFCIRASILMNHPPSYHPALKYLLYKLQYLTSSPLPSSELEEFAGYLVLDQVCRRNALREAHETKVKFGVQDRKVLNVLTSVVRGDWVVFERLKKLVNGYQLSLMRFGTPLMREHTLKCFARTYLQVDQAYLEKMTGLSWKELVEGNNVGWELKDTKVMIRKPKTR